MPSNIVAYEWLLNGTTHIGYETGDNHIHEMVIDRKGHGAIVILRASLVDLS